MFEKRTLCPDCGAKVDKKWGFCPNCGSDLSSGREREPFDSFFADVEKEFANISKIFSEPLGGISIVISGGKKPGILLNAPKQKVKQPRQIQEVKKRRTARFSEEPKTEIEKTEHSIKIKVDLPQIKNHKDIEIRRLSHSLEIRAYSGDKVYFKLIPLPEKSSVINKDFKNGKLMIEVG